MSVSLIQCQHLKYEIAGKTIFDDLSITLDAGELVAILGPNGAGKSSLFKAITGELQPHAGKVFINGKNRADLSMPDIAKTMAVLPQSATLNFAFQVNDVVLMGGVQGDVSRVKLQSMADNIMREQGLIHLKKQVYPTLSGGEKQRVHFCRILLQLAVGNTFAPQALLLDEPTSALDINHQHQLLATAQQLALSGLGVMVVLHDLNLASQYADRLVLLESGKIKANGDAESVLTKEHIHEVYGYEGTIVRDAQLNHPLVI